jgi:uncharacterized protein (TIGR02001 family)
VNTHASPLSALACAARLRPCAVPGWLLLWAFLALPAQAGDWSMALGAASDYVLRGVSFSNGRATLTADASYRSDTGWTAGLGLATLDRDSDGRRLLLTANAGHQWQLDSDWSAALGLNHTAYPGGARRRAYDSDELSATVAWRGRLTGSLSWSPDTTRLDATGRQRSGRAWAVELSARQRLFGAVALDAGIGYFELQARPRDGYASGRAGYPYASLGLSWAHGPLQAYLSRIDSRASARGLASAPRAGERWVAAALWEF